MKTVRVTAQVVDYRQEAFVEGDYLAVPDDVAAWMINNGVAEGVAVEKPAARRERAVKQGRETR